MIGYRLRKFVRRHKGQVVAASFVLFALLAGMAGTTVGLIEAKNQERKALAAADEERKAKVDAEEQKGNALRFAERKKADAARVEAQAKEAEANAVVKFFEEQVFAAARSKGAGRWAGRGRAPAGHGRGQRAGPRGGVRQAADGRGPTTECPTPHPHRRRR